MALKLLQPGIQPLGQFDGYDPETLTFLGGEVCTLIGIATGPSDLHAADIDDGYTGTVVQTRPAVSKNLVDGMRLLFLADDGTSGYGTLFGQVVGGTVGQVVAGGAVLGPHTATGSGKITLWDKPGLYAVTLDAVDTTAGTGLVPDNAGLSVADPLYATVAGLLTPDVGSAFDGLVVARFVEFTTNGSLVNTPVNLVAALNSPSGSLGAPAQLRFTEAVIHFQLET